jgi:hypothetical protein
MVDMSAIAGTVSALKGAVDITKAMIGLRDAQAIQSKVIELQGAIIAAQSSAFLVNEERTTLIQRVREFEQKIAALETWHAEKNRYHLKSIQTGVMVYALKEGMENGEEPHYLCPTCYNHGKKMILQKETQDVGRVPMWVCHECGTELIEHGLRHAAPRRRSPVSSRA